MNRYRFIFKTEDLQSSYVMQGGQVAILPGDHELVRSPTGWAEMAIGWERSRSLLGISQAVTLPLVFVEQSREILLTLWYSDNIEKTIPIWVQELQVTYTGAQLIEQYVTTYSATLKGFKDDGIKLTCTAVEEGILRKLKAAESTVLTIPITGPDVQTIAHDGIFLREKHTWLVPEQKYSGRSTTDLLGLQAIGKEGLSFGVSSFSVFNQRPPRNYSDSTEYAIRAADDVDVVIEGSFSGRFGDEFSGTFWSIVLYDSAYNIVNVFFDERGPRGPRDYSRTFSTTLRLKKDEKYFFVTRSSDLRVINESKISLSYRNRYRTTSITGYRSTDLYRKIIEQILGAQAAQALIDTAGFDYAKDYIIASGESVRSLPNPVIKTSLSQFLEYARVVHCAGEQRTPTSVKIAHRDHFINQHYVQPLTSVSVVEIFPADELHFSKLKIGYPPHNTDDVNGRYSFNNTYQYQGPMQDNEKEYSLICPYKCDPYVIETFRIDMEGKETTDTSRDNDCFIFHCAPQLLPDGRRQLLRRKYVLATGAPDIEWLYNIDGLYPPFLLEKHRPWIDGCLYGFAGQQMVFQSTDKNADLLVSDGTTTTDAKSGYTVGANPLFLNYTISCSGQVNGSMQKHMEQSNISFSVPYKGQTVKGHLLKSGLAINENMGKDFLLLMHTGTNLIQLI